MVIFYPERGRVIPTDAGMQALRSWVESAPNAGEKAARALHIKSLHTRRGALAKTLGFFWLDVPVRAAGAAIRAGYQPAHTCPLCVNLGARGLTPRGAPPRFQGGQGPGDVEASPANGVSPIAAPVSSDAENSAVRRWRTQVYGVIGDIGAHIARIGEAEDAETKSRIASDARLQMPDWRSILQASPSQTANLAGDTLCDVVLRLFDAICADGQIPEAIEGDFHAALADHLDAVNRVFAAAGLDPID